MADQCGPAAESPANSTCPSSLTRLNPAQSDRLPSRSPRRLKWRAGVAVMRTGPAARLSHQSIAFTWVNPALRSRGSLPSVVIAACVPRPASRRSVGRSRWS